MERQYPQEFSDVEVTFTNGDVKTYRISAGPTLTRYLAEQVGQTGILALLNGDVSYNIPIDQIREYEIRRVPEDRAALLRRAIHSDKKGGA